MADDNSVLGSIGVVISGDYSELNDAISQAQDVAAQGADQIAGAFNQPDIAESMTTSIQALADASGLAGGQLQIFQSVLESDADAGIALNQSLSDMASSAGTLGDAVATAAQSLLDQQQAAQDLADATNAAGNAAVEATEATEALGGASSTAAVEVQQVGGAAEESAGGMKELAEQFFAVQQALVITQGLKEFGEEALTTAGTVQSVTIGLTALT